MASNMQEFLQELPIKLAVYSRRTGIPYNTLKEWKAGRRRPPEWLYDLLDAYVHPYIVDGKKIERG